MLTERIVLAAAVAAGLTFTGCGPAPMGGHPRSDPSKSPCCFKNPAYAGTCRVQPAEDETCASILAYLNNPMAEGKSYCGGTTVRRGWTEVACEEGYAPGQSGW